MTKIQIGSKYDGPSFDRPSLRQMPRHWQLEETRRTSWPWWRDSDAWVGIVIALAAVFLLIGAARGIA